MKQPTESWADAGTRLVVIRDVPEGGGVLGPDCTLSFGSRDRGCVAPQSKQLLPDHLAVAAAMAQLVDDPASAAEREALGHWAAEHHSLQSVARYVADVVIATGGR